jgi:hypothetical protein
MTRPLMEWHITETARGHGAVDIDLSADLF